MPTGTQDKDFANQMVDHLIVSVAALDAAIEWVGKNLNPDDVFSSNDLEAWAENNGYVKE
jgi:hypothetical protein